MAQVTQAELEELSQLIADLVADSNNQRLRQLFAAKQIWLQQEQTWSKQEIKWAKQEIEKTRKEIDILLQRKQSLESKVANQPPIRGKFCVFRHNLGILCRKLPFSFLRGKKRVRVANAIFEESLI